MKLSVWAKQQGIDYKTAYRWFRDGILPVPSRQLPTGTILVDPIGIAEWVKTERQAKDKPSPATKDSGRFPE